MSPDDGKPDSPLILQKGEQDHEQKPKTIADIFLHNCQCIIIRTIPANLLLIHRHRLTGNDNHLCLFHLTNSNRYSILYHRGLKGENRCTNRKKIISRKHVQYVEKYSSATQNHGAIIERHSESPENTCVHGNV